MEIVAQFEDPHLQYVSDQLQGLGIMVPPTSETFLSKLPPYLAMPEGFEEDHEDEFGCRRIPVQELAKNWDHVAQYLDVLVGASFEREVRVTAYLDKLISLRKPNKVIDAGCGTGITLAYLALQFPEVQFVGYDLSMRMVQKARERIALCGVKNVSAILVTPHGNLATKILKKSADLLFAKASFANGSFDVPDFRSAPSPEEARSWFLRHNPQVGEWREHLEAFTHVLADNGLCTIIGMVSMSYNNLVIEVASEWERYDTERAQHMVIQPLHDVCNCSRHHDEEDQLAISALEIPTHYQH